MLKITQHSGSYRDDRGPGTVCDLWSTQAWWTPSLTSEACPNRYLWVRLGEHHLWRWEGPEQLFRVTDFFPHPGFNKDLRAHDHNDDIMLIRLPRKAHLGPAVQPLNLSQTCVSPGTQCLISGWGAVSSPKGTVLLTTQSLVSHADGLNPLCFSVSAFSSDR